MKLAIALGAAMLAVFTAAALADDYAGGAIKSVEMAGKEMLTDANGMTLYIFDKDTAGVSNCYDDCAASWPPLFADAGAAAEGDYTIIDRKDGTKMWAYKGMPLYLWVNDEKPGDVTGDGVGDVWHIAYE